MNHSEAYIKEISKKFTPSDLAKLMAHVILNETLEMAKDMSHDRGNDRETRASCLLAQTDTDELLSQATDGIYQMIVDDFFDDVSESMVKYAKEYVK